MNPQILLIEGEESQALAVQRILEPVGYEVVWATTLQDVIDFLSQSERPVIVSSLRFDPLDVFSLLRWLVVNRPQSRLIILSDSNVPPIRANGAIGFVSRAALSRLRALTSDALMGHLPSVSFADLIDVLCLLVLTKSTQRLHIIFDQEQGQIYIKQGQLLHAQTDQKIGLLAFSEILGWTGGGVYELTWEEPAQPSLNPEEAEMLLLGAQRRPSERSSDGLLSLLEDAVERSIDASPAVPLVPGSDPNVLAQAKEITTIEKDFVHPLEPTPPVSEFPEVAPAQISEAIQQELAEANAKAEEPIVEEASLQVAPTESEPQATPTSSEPTPPEPIAAPEASVVGTTLGTILSEEAPQDEPAASAPPEPTTPAASEALPATETSAEPPAQAAVASEPATTIESPQHITSEETNLQNEFADAFREDAGQALQSFTKEEPRTQTRQEILVQEVLLQNSPLADLLHAQQQMETPSRKMMKAVSKEELSSRQNSLEDAVSSEMEEVSLDGAEPGPSRVEEDEPTNDGDVWAELSQEMDASTSVEIPAEPIPSSATSVSEEPSPFDPPSVASALTLLESEKSTKPVPFLPTPSYRDVAAQKNLDELPTEPTIQATQTPPMGVRISNNKTTTQGQPYSISTPPSGTAVVKNPGLDAIRTPPMGTRIVTSAKTPPMGNPLHHATPVGTAPVPVMPTPQHATPSGAYQALTPRSPSSSSSGAYRAVPVPNPDPNMFSDYVTPPFGTRIPRGQNPDTPHAPTGSPLANAARSALHEKPPAAGASDAIAGLVPVLQEIAREVPEFVAAIAVESDSGLALGGVTSQEAIDAESGFAYYTEVLRLIKPALSLFDASLEELLVTSPKWYILLRPLREEFLLGLITTRKGNLGICRIVLKRAATQLMERLPSKEVP
jgi:predicted regulator of Ras-like GTPase activity (Roadblock/LC7/MglB family)/CheY-like chemotaxis protein